MDFCYEDKYLFFQHNGREYSCFSMFDNESLSDNDYGIAFFTSPYYRAEEDYFTVYMKAGKDKYSIGVLLPILLLEEDDEDVTNDLIPFYQRHISLAIRKLLTHLLNQDKIKADTDIRLSDYYKDVILFLYNKDTAGEDVSCIVPSLYDNGFYLKKDPFDNYFQPLYKSHYMDNETRRKHNCKERRIYVKTLKHFPNHKKFFDFLYTDLLPYVDDPFYRFFSLYQAIELLSDYAYAEQFDNYLASFEKQKLSKNDLREKLVEAASEKKQIEWVYNNVMWKDDQDLFQRIITLLDYASIEKPKSNSLYSFIYTLRNKIVHEMRNVFKYKEDVKEIVDYIEKNIFNLLAENKVKPSKS